MLTFVVKDCVAQTHDNHVDIILTLSCDLKLALVDSAQLEPLSPPRLMTNLRSLSYAASGFMRTAVTWDNSSKSAWED